MLMTTQIESITRKLLLALACLLTGCEQSPRPPDAETVVAEPNWQTQIRAVRAGKSHEIRVTTAPIGDAELAAFDGLDGLQSLTLGDTTITGAGAAQLASLHKLEQLRIAGSQIGDLGLEQLAQLPKLELLRLGSPRVTDAGLVAVGKMTELRFLILRTPQVGDAGLAHLAGLKQLESLYVEGTSVTDAGVARLHEKLPELHIHW
jgi:hypothetical protein